MNRLGTHSTHSDALTGEGGPMSHSFRDLSSADALVPRTDVALPSLGRLGRRWTREVQDAGRVWGLLTQDDLSTIECHQRTLTEMLRLRYALSPSELDRQILDFIRDHQTSSL